MLFVMKYRDQFNVKTDLIEASTPEKAQAVAEAWCHSKGYTKPQMGVVRVTPAIVADETILAPKVDAPAAVEAIAPKGETKAAPAGTTTKADPLAGMTDEELEKATNPAAQGGGEPKAAA